MVVWLKPCESRSSLSFSSQSPRDPPRGLFFTGAMRGRDRGPGRRATSRRGPPDQPGGRCYHAVYRLMRRQTARWWRSRTHERMSKVLPSKSRGLRNELREAMQQRTPVRLEREPIQHGVLHGYVIGLSSDFCLIAEIGDAMRLDGYLVVAVGDITHLEVDPAREFVDKALALRG